MIEWPVYGFADHRSRSRAKALVPIGIGVVIAIVGAVAAMVTLTDRQDAYPAAWDPQVQPLVDFVERERGLAFDHPVFIDFQSDEVFRQFAVPEPMTEAEKAENRQLSAFFRALGLVSGEFDLAKTGSSLAGDAAAAYYDPDTKRIAVRGAALDDSTRSTVVHELTHALQDQHFDLNRIEAEIDDDQAQGFQAVVEGDAERIQYRYIEQFEDEQSAAVDETADPANEGSVYDQYPPVLVAMFTAPYTLGHPLVELLEHFGDPDAIDDAIMNPPHSSEYMVNPFEYLDGKDPVAVPLPALNAGEVSFDEGTFGPLNLFLVLQERIGAKAALAAVDGWGGDRYVAFEREQRVCIRVDLRGDTPAAQGLLVAALGAWRDAMPAGSVTLTGPVASTAGDHVRLEACDPGAAATLSPPPDGPTYDRLLLPGVRSGFALDVARDELPKTFVRCVSQAFVDGLSMKDLAAAEPDVDVLHAAARAAGEKCR